MIKIKSNKATELSVFIQNISSTLTMPTQIDLQKKGTVYPITIVDDKILENHLSSCRHINEKQHFELEHGYTNHAFRERLYQTIC